MSKLGFTTREELESTSKDLFETILIASQRARQINAQQKEEIDGILGKDEEEEMENLQLTQPKIEKRILRYPHPLDVAIEDLNNKKLVHYYDR